MRFIRHHLRWTRVNDETSTIDGTLFVWYRRWHVVFAIITVVAALSALSDTGHPVDRRILGTLLLGVLVTWFWLRIARRVRRGIDARDMLLYLLVAFPLFIVLINLHPAYYLLTFFAYWQLYAYLSIPMATVSAVLLSATLLASNGGGDALSPIPIIISAAVLLVSTMFALYIDALAREAEKRQVLIDELHATRDELALQQHEAGVLAERERLAGEIHDALAQGFASIVMHLEAAEPRLDANPLTARHHLDQARQTARDSLAEARRLVRDLRPAPLEQATIDVALARTVSTWMDGTSVPAIFAVVGDVQPLSRPQETILLRATQEALANVRQHAAATRVTVTLSYMDDEVALDIRDDGRGFAELGEQDGDGGYGLIAMRQRVAAAGGALNVESAPGEGTSLAVTLPFLPLCVHPTDVAAR